MRNVDNGEKQRGKKRGKEKKKVMEYSFFLGFWMVVTRDIATSNIISKPKLLTNWPCWYFCWIRRWNTTEQWQPWSMIYKIRGTSKDFPYLGSIRDSVLIIVTVFTFFYKLYISSELTKYFRKLSADFTKGKASSLIHLSVQHGDIWFIYLFLFGGLDLVGLCWYGLQNIVVCLAIRLVSNYEETKEKSYFCFEI